MAKISQEKIRYETDPYNRLVIRETGAKSNLTYFRRVLDGTFKTGPNNTLIYHIKAPMGVFEDKGKAPYQVKLSGEWSLNKNHDLVLTLDNRHSQTVGDEITLQGQITDISSNSLSFEITTRPGKNLNIKNILELQGRWQADEHNRLTFRINKGKGRPATENWRGGHDILTFEGIWEIDKNHRIIYKYEKAQLIRKMTVKKTLVFDGFFDITKRNRLSYKLSADGKSGFEFRTGLGFLHEDYIKYEIGIGGTNKDEPIKRTLVLYGKWKIRRNAGLLFEIEYGRGKSAITTLADKPATEDWRGKPKTIKFGADARLNKTDEVEFSIKNEEGKNLGMELKLSRKLLAGDGEAFLKLLKDKKEAAVYIGAGWRW